MRNVDEGVELSFILEILLEAPPRHNVAGADVETQDGRLFGCFHVSTLFPLPKELSVRLTGQIIERERALAARFLLVIVQAVPLDAIHAPRPVSVQQTESQAGQ